jgi:hypothetical protein
MTETHVAIQGVCAWPNLTRLPDGTIIATLFNQPTHGGWEGDLDCWASTDDGGTWTFRGRPGPHEAGTTRMNCAAGLAANGDLLVLCSGWDGRAAPYGQSKPFAESNTLCAWICRSSDQARTWRRTGELPGLPERGTLIPFGRIVIAGDGTLRAAVYASDKHHDEKRTAVYMLVSRDDGVTWQVLSKIAESGNETALLPLAQGRWLALSRMSCLSLYASSDNGDTWDLEGPLTLPRQFPGDLLRLADGRIVATYGNRNANNFGVDTRISRDGGVTWGPPARVSAMPSGDGGYPSSVQLADGRILTAFYCQISGKHHYEMFVSTWNADDFDAEAYALRWARSAGRP